MFFFLKQTCFFLGLTVLTPQELKMRTFFHVQNKTVVVPNNVPQHFYTDVGIFFLFKTVKQKPMTL